MKSSSHCRAPPRLWCAPVLIYVCLISSPFSTHHEQASFRHHARALGLTAQRGSEASGDSGGAQHAVGQTPLPAGGKVEAAASPPSPGAESDAGSSDTDSETERVGCYIALF